MALLPASIVRNTARLCHLVLDFAMAYQSAATAAM
jgi:hypothetical protein